MNRKYVGNNNIKVGFQNKPYNPSLRIVNFQNNFTNNNYAQANPLSTLADPMNAKGSVLRREILKKSPENAKSFSKVDNMSASKDPVSRQRQKLLKQQSSKKQVRPSSHRRIIRPKNTQESDVKTASIIVKNEKVDEDFFDDGQDSDVEIDENESLWGSSLDFDDGEGEDYEEDEPPEFKSYDNVPTATNAHKIVDVTELEPEMRKHFDKVSCEYNLEDTNGIHTREHILDKNPTRYNPRGNSNKGVQKKISVISNHSKSFKNKNSKYV